MCFDREEGVRDEDTWVKIEKASEAVIYLKSSHGCSLSGNLLIASYATKNDTPARECIGRPVDREWIDIDLMKSWKADCEEGHGTTCSWNSHKDHRSPQLPLLIDAEHQCLSFNKNNEVRYIALSYVWGELDVLKTTRKNLNQLSQSGAFLQPSTRLPATLRDAISVTRLLGERYLWVDALCIIQDDEEIRRFLINNMAAIYGGAVLTIVAADGTNADDGLRGLRGLSASRDNSCIFAWPDGTRLNWPACNGLCETIWDERAWTFQEYMFSRRRLLFVSGSIRWECRSACFWEEHCEEGSLPTEETTWNYDTDSAIIRRAASKVNMGFPDMLSFDTIVNAFSSRQCTYKDDIMNAFSGVLGLISHRFIGGFIWGSPVMFLDLALVWRGMGSEDESRRWDPWATTGCHNHAPTWSWASWEGELHTAYVWNNEDWLLYTSYEWFYNSDPVRRIVPLVRWTTRTTADPAEEARDIPYLNEWYKLKMQYLAADPPPPPRGWSQWEINFTHHNRTFSLREDIVASPANPQTRGHYLDPSIHKNPPRHYYTHSSTGHAKFCFPLPMEDEVAQARIETNVNNTMSRYLCGSTNRAFFELREGDRENVYSLFEIGHTDLDPSPAGRFWSDEPLERGMRVIVELVAISFKYKAREHERWKDPHGDERAQLYNVLRVEWKDGVAYRKGIGEIEREIWERQTLDPVDMILG